MWIYSMLINPSKNNNKTKMALVGHTITLIDYDVNNVDGAIDQSYPGGVNGYTINTVDLDTSTWTTQKGYKQSIGANSVPGGADHLESIITQTWDAMKVNVFVQRELELQETYLAGALSTGDSTSATTFKANISYLSGLGIIGLTAGTAWASTTEGYPASGGTNPPTPALEP
jgi:hypothetical protein